jgi:hypothetical protein
MGKWPNWPWQWVLATIMGRQSLIHVDSTGNIKIVVARHSKKTWATWCRQFSKGSSYQFGQKSSSAPWSQYWHECVVFLFYFVLFWANFFNFSSHMY